MPLLGFIGRLDYQKGVDIIRDSYDWLMAEGCQLVLLGSGREDLEHSLRCVCSTARQTNNTDDVATVADATALPSLMSSQ